MLSTVELARRGELRQMAPLLYSGSISPNEASRDALQETALHVAAARSDLPLIHLLRKYLANPFAEDTRRRAPIDIAIKIGNEVVVEQLVTYMDEYLTHLGRTMRGTRSSVRTVLPNYRKGGQFSSLEETGSTLP